MCGWVGGVQCVVPGVWCVLGREAGGSGGGTGGGGPSIQTLQDPSVRSQTCAWQMPQSTTKASLRFTDIVCVPSVSLQFVGRMSSHHCVVHDVKKVSKVNVLLVDCLLDQVFFLSTVFLVILGISSSIVFTVCCTCVLSTFHVIWEREEDWTVGATSKFALFTLSLCPLTKALGGPSCDNAVVQFFEILPN